ncbi:MAG TPA: thiaminase II [Thermomicrobiales bacterium]|nr:thiaminase II [Thermomicrobiales bacterium]
MDITTTMTASQRFRHAADAIWEAQHDHPFVRGIGDGSLDGDRFGYWLRQDYLYLIDYSRLFGAAVLRAPELEAMTRFAELLHGILVTEMDLHRSYVAGFGITEADLLRETKAPTTQAYTDFLLRIATTGDYPALLGALLPCMWGYNEIGLRLAERGMPDDERYQAWIEMYASAEFTELAAWCRALTDDACAGLPESALQRVEDAFITSSRYELAFWEMAWTNERWLA